MELPTVPPADDSPPSDSPEEILARIDAREREIERTLREARETAAAIVEEARNRAQALTAVRREAAVREGAERGARIVAEARRAAEDILAAGVREAAAVRATPAERIAQVAGELLAVVLPPAAPGGDRS